MNVADKIALSVPEAAELVSVSAPTIRRLIREGKLSRVPYTDRVIIARAELDRWINGSTHLTESVSLAASGDALTAHPSRAVGATSVTLADEPALASVT